MNKSEWYLESTRYLIPGQSEQFVIRHKGCFVVGDKNRNWGSIRGSYCPGCDEEIPNHLLVQRSILNGE